MKTGRSETKRKEKKQRETDGTHSRRRPSRLFSFLFVSFLFFSFLSLCACKKAPQSAATAQADAPAGERVIYQCPMHPKIIRDKPGHCPICGMPLVKIQADGPQAPASSAELAEVKLGAERTQSIGLTYGTVEDRNLALAIDAPGRIGYDPELFSAITEYRQALATRRRLSSGGAESRRLARSLARAAKDKLRLLGFSARQIEALAFGKKEKEAQRSLILPEENGSVWVYAQVYEFEAGKLRRGQLMKVTAPGLPGKVFTAPILSIDPTVDALTRTVRVRGRLSSPEGTLRPDNYVNVEITIPLGSRLSVPASAVLETGTSQYVFVAGPNGKLDPRQAVLGERAGEFREVLSGLQPGEKVVTSADFLIDSEARIEAAARAFRASSGKDKGAMPGMKM